MYKLGPWSEPQNPYLQSSKNGVVGRLGLVVVVKQQRRLASAPRLFVGDSPDGDANAFWYRQACIGHGHIVVGAGAFDIQLGDGDLGNAAGSQSR